MEISRRGLLSTTLGLAALAALDGALPQAAQAAAVTTWRVASPFNVRSGPSTGTVRVGVLSPGAVVSGTVVTNGRLNITSGTHAGRYCHTSLMTLVATNSPYVTAILVGGVPLKLGWNGTRVGLVQRKLGIVRTGSDQTYDVATRDAVVAYQKRNGLEADGIVGPKTWAKLDTGWAYTIDAYQVQPVLTLNATAAQRIEQMIKYALDQRGAHYSWGGAGPYKLGFDCSGLVLQAICSAGLDPQPINVIKHAEPTYRTSRELYGHTKLRTLPVGQRRRGDLLFWTNSSGNINHVAIYLGDNKMVETGGRPVKITTVRTTRLAPNLKRVFG